MVYDCFTHITHNSQCIFHNCHWLSTRIFDFLRATAKIKDWMIEPDLALKLSKSNHWVSSYKVVVSPTYKLIDHPTNHKYNYQSGTRSPLMTTVSYKLVYKTIK